MHNLPSRRCTSGSYLGDRRRSTTSSLSPSLSSPSSVASMAAERLRKFASAAAAAAVSITRPNYFDTGKRGMSVNEGRRERVKTDLLSSSLSRHLGYA